MRQLLVSATVVAVLLAASSVRAEDDEWQEPEPPTDAQVKKMKVRELKQWLADRGLSCTDCFEKGDFQRFLKKNRDAKLLPSKRPKKISKDPIEKQWKKVAAELSEEVGLPADGVKRVSTVVAGSFEQHARRVAKTMHVEKHVLTHTSLSDPFVLAMSKQITALAKWVKAEDIKSQDKIRPKIDNQIKMFLTAVASKNVNPMYEILDGHRDEL